MAGSLPFYKLGPASYTAGAAITGGQLVRATKASGDVVSGVVAPGSSVVTNDSATSANGPLLGVALTDAGTSHYPEGVATTGSTGVALDISGVDFTVAVANNVDIHVKYSATAAFGQALFADGSGGVNVTTSNTPVGHCTQPGGVASGAVGRAYIRV